MGPILMAAIIVGLTSAFAWSANQRMKLLSTGRPDMRWDRIPERLRAVGYGETVPLADNNSDAGRAENRRVEFRLLAGAPEEE